MVGTAFLIIHYYYFITIIICILSLLLNVYWNNIRATENERKIHYDVKTYWNPVKEEYANVCTSCIINSLCFTLINLCCLNIIFFSIFT